MGKILKYWPKEEIIKALQKLPKNEPINKKTIKKYSKLGLMCNSSLISLKFGSLKNACDEANVRCDALYGKEKTIYMSNLNIIYTKEKLKEILIKASKIYEKTTPTNFIIKINQDNNIDIRLAIKRYYGNIENALKDCNIQYDNYYWTNERILDTLRDLNTKYGPLYKIQINNFRRKKMLCGSKLIRDRFGSVENAAKIAGFSFIEPQNIGHLYNGKIGKTETQILDSLELQFNIIILRQYRIEIENNIYFLDGYDQKHNVVYEIDDKYHSYETQKIIDNIRDKKIIDFLKCQIIRIKNY